jgi:penicillin amidase
MERHRQRRACPGVAIGHNERVAWGFTIAGSDQADLYVEDTHPDDPGQYRVGERWEKMTVVREKVAVKGKATVEVELRHAARAGHPPGREAEGLRLEMGRLRAGHRGLPGSLALNRAGNGKEFLAAVDRWKLPAENLVYADVDGNIGWIAGAMTPFARAGMVCCRCREPGEYEWRGFLATKDLPQTLNPSSHFLLTANHNNLPAGYKHAIGYEWSPGHRFERLRERLTAKQKFGLDDFQSMQHDETSLPGRRLARLAARLEVAGDASEKAALKAVAEWDGVLSRDSRPGAIASVWTQELLTEFFRPHVSSVRLLEYVRGGYGLDVMLAALGKPERFWFGADPGMGRDALLRKTLTAAVGKLEKLQPGEPSAWRWGRMHTMTFEHSLTGMGPAFAEAFNLAPVERGGDSHTPNNARHDERFRQIHGVVSPGIRPGRLGPRMVTSTPGSPASRAVPHYADLLPLWAEGKYFRCRSRGRRWKKGRHTDSFSGRCRDCCPGLRRLHSGLLPCRRRSSLASSGQQTKQGCFVYGRSLRVESSQPGAAAKGDRPCHQSVKSTGS